MTPKKKPKPMFRVEFDLTTSRPWRWEWRIVARNGEIVCSAAHQLHSRKIDATRIVRKLARAFLAGRVEIQA